jgi:hypothetical protein
MPEHHDPIDDLSRFGAGLSNGRTGGDMPLSAADVRRRGDQIRRRRTALVAGGAALAVAAVAVPIFAVVGGGTPRSDQDRVAQDPGPALSADDLLRDADTEYEVGRKGAFTTVDTYRGDGQATFHPCQQQKLSALGATDSFTRSYDQGVQLEQGDTAPPDVSGDGLVETIAEFEDAAAARAAYDTLAQWLVECDTIPGADEVTVQPKARSVEVRGADAVVYDLMWGPAPEEVDPFGDSAFINETGLVLKGDRIAVVAVTIVGQDYNFLPDYGTPVERMVPTAAERLTAGAAAPTESASPSDDAGDTDDTSDTGDTGDTGAVLPPGFERDLLLEMVTNDSGDPVVASPDADGVGAFDFCGTVVETRDSATDRLAANASGPEYGEAREALVLPSTEDAQALVDDIVAAARSCPESGTDGSTARNVVTTLEDQPMPTTIISQTYATDGAPQLGTTTWVVSHLGPVVLLATSYGEGSPEPDDVDRTTAELLDRLATAMGAVVDAVGVL